LGNKIEYFIYVRLKPIITLFICVGSPLTKPKSILPSSGWLKSLGKTFAESKSWWAVNDHFPDSRNTCE